MARPLDDMTKLHSRLRCVANGKTEVNGSRQQNGAVRLNERAAQGGPAFSSLDAGQGLKTCGRDVRGAKRGSSQTTLSDKVEVNVFVLFNPMQSEIFGVASGSQHVFRDDRRPAGSRSRDPHERRGGQKGCGARIGRDRRAPGQGAGRQTPNS